MRIIQVFILTISITLFACSSDKNKINYADVISEAGESLTIGNYQEALTAFMEAQEMNPEGWEAYNGIGWCNLILDSLSESASSFSTGSTKPGAKADVFAGWAFVLNAQKDYSTSNSKSQMAISLDSSWTFTFGLGLSVSDLRVLRAANYFLLGSYSQSKAEVVILNPTFASVDVSTDSGRAQLAEEIETRKGLAKKK
jgi:tetratricopeptide (TPR) repeat protein